MSHIGEAAVHILDALVLLDILAEWAVSLLNVGELVFVLQEELAAPLAHGDRYVRHHVLVVPSAHAGAQLGVIHDEHLLVPHVLHDSLVDLHGLGAVWVHLGLKLFQHLLGE